MLRIGIFRNLRSTLARSYHQKGTRTFRRTKMIVKNRNKNSLSSAIRLGLICRSHLLIIFRDTVDRFHWLGRNIRRMNIIY